MGCEMCKCHVRLCEAVCLACMQVYGEREMCMIKAIKQKILYMNACVRRGLRDDQYQEINAMSPISYIPPFARCQSMQTVLIPE